MEFKNTETFNFEGAFRGMRNAHESWDRADSWFGIIDMQADDGTEFDIVDNWIEFENIERRERGLEELSHDMKYYHEYYDALEDYSLWLINTGELRASGEFCDMAFLGPNDLHLAQNLILAGDEHAKFMRQIMVSVDITAPIFWWKEMDTYKVGTTANSTSTMHKLTSKPITLDCFEIDDYEEHLPIDTGDLNRYIHGDVKVWEEVGSLTTFLEHLRRLYLETNDVRYWKELIRWLPESWLQTRTWTANYQVLRNIYFQRKNHKLKEWHEFCDWIKSLPYANELIIIGDKDETN